MSGTKGKAWIVAASIGAVEALKDQGVCRWNYTIRSLQQNAINNIKSVVASQSRPNNSLSSLTSSTSSKSTTLKSGGTDQVKNSDVHLKKREESFAKVIELSCWGPSTTRF